MSRLFYLNQDVMNGINEDAFRATRPFPWLNSANFLSRDGFTRLVETLPDVALFKKNFGYTRKYGQQSHDRFTLTYNAALPVAQPWHEFVRELLGTEYRDFLDRIMGRGQYRLLLHWHYTPGGCSVSPHCDAKRKLGSHIFYFNTGQDWREEWGGQTMILDDHGRFDSDSAPDFADFDSTAAGRSIGNYSLLFTRRGNSWHGVRPITCPDHALRKVFIVVIEDWRLQWRAVNFVRGEGDTGFRPGVPPR